MEKTTLKTIGVIAFLSDGTARQIALTSDETIALESLIAAWHDGKPKIMPKVLDGLIFTPNDKKEKGEEL